MNSIVTFALKQRMLMVIVMVFLFGAGVICFTRLNIEAYPDPVPPRVEVITQSPGQSAEEIERYFTIPIEIQMGSIPHITSVTACHNYRRCPAAWYRKSRRSVPSARSIAIASWDPPVTRSWI